jgi:hypothetical protein
MATPRPHGPDGQFVRWNPPDRVDIVTRVRPAAPKPTRIARLLDAVGIRTTPSATGAYADCPFCDRFAGLIIEPGGKRWHVVCGCRPARERYGAADLMADLAGLVK